MSYLTSSDIIAITATIISIFAFILTFLSYRRERSKSNQDLLYQEKISAYKINVPGKHYI